MHACHLYLRHLYARHIYQGDEDHHHHFEAIMEKEALIQIKSNAHWNWKSIYKIYKKILLKEYVWRSYSMIALHIIFS